MQHIDSILGNGTVTEDLETLSALIDSNMLHIELGQLGQRDLLKLTYRIKRLNQLLKKHRSDRLIERNIRLKLESFIDDSYALFINVA